MKSDNLNDFQGYLVSKSAVNEKYAPYYVRWVSSCYAFANQPLSDVLTQVQKQDFLKQFAKNHEDWQVKQADNALRLQECLSLRIKDVDIEQGILIVRSGKGDKDKTGINTYIAPSGQYRNCSGTAIFRPL